MKKEEKIEEKTKKTFSKLKIIKITVISTIIILAIIALSIYIYNKNKKLDITYITAQLEKSSELTTATLKFKGIYDYEDSGVAVINKANFIMLYEATARAGIDISEVKIEQDNFKPIVWVTIPKAKVLDIKVDTNSIKYLKTDFTLLNTNPKEDANKANSLAEKDAKTEVEQMGILEAADQQAEALVKGVIQDIVPKKYDIQIKK